MKIASRLGTLRPSETLAIGARAAALRAGGADIVSLAAGEPDFDTPEHVREAASTAIGQGHSRYTAVAGAPDLRDAIARAAAARGLSYGRDEVVVTAGAKQALANAALALFDPGDEVIVPAPYWVTYPAQIDLAGARAVIVPTLEADGFRLRAEALRAHLGPKTRGLVLCSPSNPTGSCYREEDLRAIADVVRGSDIVVVSDEIYGALTYDGFAHRSIVNIAPDLRDRVVIVDGVSKTYAMTGWRIGWALAPKPIAEAMVTLQSHQSSNASSIAQRAALAAVAGSQDCVTTMRAEFERRRRLMVEGLRTLPGVHCRMPEGAFYAFADFRDTCARMGGSESLARRLLDEAYVATVPGAAFGAEGYLRLSYATSSEQIEKGLERIGRFLAS